MNSPRAKSVSRFSETAGDLSRCVPVPLTRRGVEQDVFLGEHFFYPNIFIPSTAQKLFRFSRAGNDKVCMTSVLKRLFPALCFSSSLYRKKGKDPVERRLVLP